jgi:pterin-4a-carbinolamine dehydratase
MNLQWQERNRPLRLERRYEFSDYEKLRDFLDQAAKLSETKNLYPDIGFGKSYVNMTIHADEEDHHLHQSHREFAEELEQIMGQLSQTAK